MARVWVGLSATAAVVALGVLAACAADDGAKCVESKAAPLVEVCASSATLLKGVDVSKWQATIDWSSVKAAGYEFAFIRASDGLNYPDDKFQPNWQGAKAAGVLRGTYQFFRPSQDPIAQADLMLGKLAGAGWIEAGDLPCVIDIETAEGQSNTTIRNKALQWMQYVEQQTGKKPIVYTSAGWSTVLGTALSAYPLWVANYTGDPYNTCPLMPDGWSQWVFWQYTSKGPVAGVGSKDVDKNVFDGTISDLLSFIGSGVKPPPVVPDGGTDPCSKASSGNGPYCGATIGGALDTLYDCENGATASQTACPLGCMVMPPGQADKCAAAVTDVCANATSGNGHYCGKTLGGDANALYDCQNGTTASTTPCEYGCVLNPPGVADQCAPPPPVTDSGAGGANGGGGGGTGGAPGGGGASSGGASNGGSGGWSGDASVIDGSSLGGGGSGGC